MKTLKKLLSYLPLYFVLILPAAAAVGPYTISVATTGLSGSGLQVSLSSASGVELMSINADGTQAFSNTVNAGTSYVVSVANMPVGQYCNIEGASYSFSASSDATINVVCTTVKSLGGNVSGLIGELKLRLNSSTSETLTLTSNGAYVFNNKQAMDEYYAVRVSTQPAGQLCSVNNPGGIIGANDINNIDINCVTDNNGYQVSSYISGLTGKDGLIVLDLNGVEQVASTLTGRLTFATQLASNEAYNITIAYLSSNLECDLVNNTGSINVTDYPYVNVTCRYLGTSTSIAPEVSSGMLSSGEEVVLTLNGTEDMTLNGYSYNSKAFNTRLAFGEAYNVTLKTLPAGKNCNLFNASGIIKEDTIPLIEIDCFLVTDPLYTMGGTISGLTGSGLVLSVDDSVSMEINPGDISYTTPYGFPAGKYHRVRVKTNPIGQICSVADGYRYIYNSNIINADIICGPGPHTIGGYVDGLTGNGLSLVLNDTEILPISTAGDFTFDSLFSDGMVYSVEVASQPDGQFCVINNKSGWKITASVNYIFVTCTDISYQVKVNVNGYKSSTSLILSLNNSSNLSVYSNTSSTSLTPVPFAEKVADGASYEVQIVRQPVGQVCTLTNSSGVVNAADVTNVAATCVANTADSNLFTVGYSVSGLEGSGLVLQLNGNSDQVVDANGYATFATTLTDTEAYSVTVATQPGTPLQYCAVTAGSGNITAANVSDIGIVCGNGVQPLYSSGALWMRHVKNDGVDEYSASNAWCASNSTAGTAAGCLNGGEYKTILLQHLNSCNGVSATDNLGLFDWTCIDNNGIRLVTNKLKTGKFMSDMMDFTEIAFKPNFVTVDDGVTFDSTRPSVWWKNKVIQNNTGAFVSSDTVHLVTDSVTRRYSMEERSALIMKPGTTLTAPAGRGATVGTGYVYDFLWFEGNIQGDHYPDMEGILWPGGHASVINNTSVQGVDGRGIYIDGNHLRMNKVNSSNNGVGINIYGGSYSTLLNLTANNNTGYAGIKMSAAGSTIRNLVANGNTNANAGIVLTYVYNTTISNLTANNNKMGIELTGISPTYVTNYVPANIDGLTANGNTGTGVKINSMYGGKITNIEAHNNGIFGAELSLYHEGATKKGTTVNHVHTTGNGDDGLRIGGSLNKYTNIKTANNGGAGLSTTYIYKSLIQDAVSNNNGGAGFELPATANIIAENITSTNNGGRGIEYSLYSSGGLRASVFMNVTSANNVGDGFLAYELATQFSSMLIANNGGNGFVAGKKDNLYVENYIVNNLVSANNTGFGIDLYSDNDYFTGLLQVGFNSAGDCQVYTGSTQYPNYNTGLVENRKGKKNYNKCIVAGLSDATLIAGVDVSTTLAGEVSVDDILNPDDINGVALFENLTSWFAFENGYRAWGVDGLDFANTSNQGACNTIGANCRIWDWSISTTDAGNAGTPVSYNVLTLPGGDDTLSIDWTTYEATGQAFCDIEFSGSSWDGAATCTTTYLRHAREISGDSIGNDNALCESGETCLYTPNIGAYQGHGELISAGSYTDGTLTGITLMKYENLGR